MEKGPILGVPGEVTRGPWARFPSGAHSRAKGLPGGLVARKVSALSTARGAVGDPLAHWRPLGKGFPRELDGAKLGRVPPGVTAMPVREVSRWDGFAGSVRCCF